MQNVRNARAFLAAALLLLAGPTLQGRAEDPQGTASRPAATPAAWVASARELIAAAAADMPQSGGPDALGPRIDLATAYAVIGDAKEAKAAFDSARALASDEDKPEYEAQDYVDIAAAQATAGYFKDALKTISDAKAALSRADRRSQIAFFALSNLAGAQAQAKDFDGAMVTARRVASMREMVGAEDQVWMAYSAVAEARAHAGDVAGARSTAKLVPNREHAAQALAEVAGELARSGNYREAMVTAEQFETKPEQGAAYSWIAVAAANAGNLQQANAAARPIANDDEAVEPWASIAAAQVRQKDVAGAKATATKIRDARCREQAMARVAAALAGTGDLVGAKDMAEALKDEAARSEALAAIAEAQGANRDVAAASATAGGITDKYWKSRALVGIAIPHGSRCVEIHFAEGHTVTALMFRSYFIVLILCFVVACDRPPAPATQPTSHSTAKSSGVGPPAGVPRGDGSERQRNQSNPHAVGLQAGMSLGDEEALAYTLDPTAAFQQAVACRTASVKAPTPTNFYIIANLGDNKYEAAMYKGLTGDLSDSHFILQAVVTTFESTGRASLVIEYESTSDVEMKNGFSSRVAEYREATAEGETRSMKATEAWAIVRSLADRGGRANRILIASLYATQFRSTKGDARAQRSGLKPGPPRNCLSEDVEDLAELVGTKDASESMDDFVKHHNAEYWILHNALNAYYGAVTRSLRDYATSTKDSELIRAAEAFGK